MMHRALGMRNDLRRQCVLLVKVKAAETTRSDGIREQSEVTYREDGDKNASSAKHTVANGVSVFGRVLDGLIIAVKPSTVRLNSAGLNDQERQAGWCEEAVSGTERMGVVGVDGWGERERERDGGGGLIQRKLLGSQVQAGGNKGTPGTGSIHCVAVIWD